MVMYFVVIISLIAIVQSFGTNRSHWSSLSATPNKKEL